MNLDTIQSLEVSAYKIPTDFPESDGTISWDSTTVVLVIVRGSGKSGMGYTFASQATAFYIEHTLKELVLDANIMDVPATWQSMVAAVRNDGNAGIAAMAIAAIDIALWDLKAKVLDSPLAKLLGMKREAMLIYGSGGFTSYPIEMLQNQLGSWVEDGMTHVKMKVGRSPQDDLERVKMARQAMGEEAQLFVDANGAYDPKQAIEKAQQFLKYGVNWMEEPVPSSDLSGLAFIRQKVPAEINIAAGEYGYNLYYFQHMLEERAVDVLQADATRCGGLSGFLKASDLCAAHQLLFSSHCAPAVHLHAAVAVSTFYIAEYFYDHVRIENILFDGVQKPKKGKLYPDLSRPGIGLELKEADALPYKI